MNPGLPQGFIRFGTVPHRILLLAHTIGRITHSVVLEELGVEPREAGMNLTRLRRFGFLVRIGRVDGYEENCRTQAAYSLPAPEVKKLKDFENKSAAERTRRMRAKKQMKVPSVFQFRGVIPCTETIDQLSDPRKRRGKSHQTTTTKTMDQAIPMPMPKPLRWKQPTKHD